MKETVIHLCPTGTATISNDGIVRRVMYCGKVIKGGLPHDNFTFVLSSRITCVECQKYQGMKLLRKL